MPFFQHDKKIDLIGSACACTPGPPPATRSYSVVKNEVRESDARVRKSDARVPAEEGRREAKVEPIKKMFFNYECTEIFSTLSYIL